MAIRLQQAGLSSFTIYEAAPDVGGTWFHNAYPGAACDIGSHLYSFSFKRNHEWTKTYAGHELTEKLPREGHLDSLRAWCSLVQPSTLQYQPYQ